MDKKKLEQVIMVVLIPVFLLGLLYARSRTSTPAKPAKERSEAMVAEEELSGAEDKGVDKAQKPALAQEQPAAEPSIEAEPISYEGGGRDPLKNPFKAYLDQLKKNKPIKRSDQVPLPSFSIEGLVWNTGMPQAIVNGKIIKIGDTIDGVKVVNIDKGGITVEYQGEPVFISKK